jgi:hypothetical protein
MDTNFTNVNADQITDFYIKRNDLISNIQKYININDQNKIISIKYDPIMVDVKTLIINNINTLQQNLISLKTSEVPIIEKIIQFSTINSALKVNTLIYIYIAFINIKLLEPSPEPSPGPSPEDIIENLGLIYDKLYNPYIGKYDIDNDNTDKDKLMNHFTNNVPYTNEEYTSEPTPLDENIAKGIVGIIRIAQNFEASKQNIDNLLQDIFPLITTMTVGEINDIPK